MKLAVLWLSILVACEAGTPPVANPTTPADVVDPPLEPACGATLEVARLIDISEEGSNMGGAHFTFAIDEPGVPRFVHGGGHEFALVPFGRKSPPMGYYVVEVVWRPQRFRVWDGGWGLGHLPVYAGVVLRAVAVRDRAEALRRLPDGLDGVNRDAILHLTPDLPAGAYEVPEAP